MNNSSLTLNVSSCFRSKICALLPLVICALCLNGCGKDEKETFLLKLNLSKNDSFQVRIQSDETVDNTEGIRLVRQTSTMDAKLEVIDVDSDGVYSFRVIFDPIVMVADSRNGHFEFSSWQNNLPENPDIRDLCAFYSILCSRAIIVKVTPQGRIVRILGNEKLFYELVDLLQPDPQTAENLKLLTSEDGIKDVIRYFFQILPDREIGKDEIWKDRQVFKMDFPMDVLTTTTLSDINKNTADLTCLADIGIDTSSVYGPERYKGWQNRTVSIDTKTGMVKRSKIVFSCLELIRNKGLVRKIKSQGTITVEVK